MCQAFESLILPDHKLFSLILRVRATVYPKFPKKQNPDTTHRRNQNPQERPNRKHGEATASTLGALDLSGSDLFLKQLAWL